MKRLYFVLLAVGCTTIASAQVRFGVKAGVNLVNIMESGLPEGANTFTSRTDFNAGLLASLPLFCSFYLQPEVLYSGQGGDIQALGTTTKLEYGYLNVPVLFKYQHKSGLFAETGPQIGFLLSAKEKANGQSYDAKSGTQSVDFAWAVGVGYKLPLGLGIDARYNLGLTNLIKNDNGETAKNSVFQFGLFYMLKRL